VAEAEATRCNAVVKSAIPRTIKAKSNLSAKNSAV
jgi:hypothetical protein